MVYTNMFVADAYLFSVAAKRVNRYDDSLTLGGGSVSLRLLLLCSFHK